jgi:hypothetical protein
MPGAGRMSEPERFRPRFKDPKLCHIMSKLNFFVAAVSIIEGGLRYS